MNKIKIKFNRNQYHIQNIQDHLFKDTDQYIKADQVVRASKMRAEENLMEKYNHQSKIFKQ